VGALFLTARLSNPSSLFDDCILGKNGDIKKKESIAEAFSMKSSEPAEHSRTRKGTRSKVQILSVTEGAIRTVLHLALSGSGRKVPSQEICESQEISPAFLIKVTRPLTKKKLISAVRGVGGGFTLARPPEAISLLEVIEAVQGPFVFNECLIGPDACHRQASCPVHPVWKQIRESTESILSGWTLADLAWVSRKRTDPVSGHP